MLHLHTECVVVQNREFYVITAGADEIDQGRLAGRARRMEEL